MLHLFEKLVASIWNRLKKRGHQVREERGSFDFGFRVLDGQVTKRRLELSNGRRAMHIAILGKTGSGKSFALRHAAEQDVEAGRGFMYFDFHGDAISFLLRTIQPQGAPAAEAPERSADSH